MKVYKVFAYDPENEIFGLVFRVMAENAGDARRKANEGIYERCARPDWFLRVDVTEE
jgi:hypothetical protein